MVLLLTIICSFKALGASKELEQEFELEVERLSKSIVEKMPAKYKKEMGFIGDGVSLKGLSEGAYLWLSDQIQMQERKDLGRIADKFPQIRFESDMVGIINHAVWSAVRGFDFDISKDLDRLENFWKEAEPPAINLNPETGAKVEWIWSLPTDKRNDGKIHVGVEVTSRHFVCFEHGQGFYTPQGILLERIRSEIVQDRMMASDHVGKGFLDKGK